MKIRELFLTEQDINDGKDLEKLKELIQIRKDDFEPKTIDYIFKQGKYLYRGIKDNKNFFIKSPRKDRTPRDSGIFLHNFINEIMNNLNIKANRSNSFFTTNDRGRASIYGNVYIVFPLKGFSFFTNTFIEDLYLDFPMIAENFINKKFEENREYYIILSKYLKDNDDTFDYFFDKFYSLKNNFIDKYNTTYKDIFGYSFENLIKKITGYNYDILRIFFKKIVLNIDDRKKIIEKAKDLNLDIKTFEKFLDSSLEVFFHHLIGAITHFKKINDAEFIENLKQNETKKIFLFFFKMIDSNEFKKHFELIFKNHSVYENNVDKFSPEFIDSLNVKNETEILINGESLFINESFFKEFKTEIKNIFKEVLNL